MLEGEDPILSPATPDSDSAGVPTATPPETPPAPAEPPTEGTPTGEPPKADDDKPILEPEQKEEVNEFAGAPENYEDFTIPEHFTMDDAGREEANQLFRQLNLSQKGAQTLIDAWVKKATDMQEAQLNQLADQRKAWRSEIRNTPTFAADRALAQKGIKAVVKTDAERALFQDTWLSDHPAVFSLFARIGSLLGEDSPSASGKAPAEQNVNRLRFPIQ